MMRCVDIQWAENDIVVTWGARTPEGEFGRILEIVAGRSRPQSITNTGAEVIRSSRKGLSWETGRGRRSSMWGHRIAHKHGNGVCKAGKRVSPSVGSCGRKEMGGSNGHRSPSVLSESLPWRFAHRKAPVSRFRETVLIFSGYRTVFGVENALKATGLYGKLQVRVHSNLAKMENRRSESCQHYSCMVLLCALSLLDDLLPISPSRARFPPILGVLWRNQRALVSVTFRRVWTMCIAETVPPFKAKRRFRRAHLSSVLSAQRSALRSCRFVLLR